MNELVFELHFGVPDHEIRGLTRNRCSDSVMKMIYETASILYPGDEFDVYFYPSQPGSYADFMKLVKKKPLESIIAIATVGAFVYTGLTYNDDHQDHLNNQNINILENATQKCPDFRRKIEEMKKSGFELDEIGDEALKAVCENVKITKSKNDYWQSLQQDGTIKYDEIILKNSGNASVVSKKVDSQDFLKYVEYLPEDDQYNKGDFRGVIELISPVFKQKKQGKGTPWKGIYYGEDIKEKGIAIIENGEEISFYMQDSDFKKKIAEGGVSFQAGDNIKVEFGIFGLLNTTFFVLQNRKIYVNFVEKFNEDIVEHKQKLEAIRMAKPIINNSQLPLFN